jgi:hypothetical protein
MDNISLSITLYVYLVYVIPFCHYQVFNHTVHFVRVAVPHT